MTTSKILTVVWVVSYIVSFALILWGDIYLEESGPGSLVSIVARALVLSILMMPMMMMVFCCLGMMFLGKDYDRAQHEATEGYLEEYYRQYGRPRR